jgi:cytochrome P450
MAVPLPPGPRGRLFTGHLPDFRNDRLNFFTRCARDWGDFVLLRFGSRRIYLVSDPHAIEEVLVTHSRDYSKHFALRLNPSVLGNGLLTSEGDFWLRQRRLIQPAFQRARLNAYAADMLAAADRVLGSWSAGETRDVLSEMSRLALMIAGKTLFGAEVEGDARDVGQALEVLLERFRARFASVIWLPRWVPTPGKVRFDRAVRRLDEIIYRFIRERRESGDLLSILLQARDEDDGSRMTDRQVRDEAMTLFLAGHETTALTLSWTWYLLAQNPDVAERLAAEVDDVLAGRPPGADDLPRLRYAEQVVQEAMRILPPIYTIGREALREGSIGGYCVPKGTTILMSQWVVHRDARWFERPLDFRPERWSDDRVKQLPRFAYFPFGGGPRMCIGNTFAMIEAVLVLARIAQRFRFTIVPDHPVEPWPTFTLRPRNGIKVVIAPRAGRSPHPLPLSPEGRGVRGEGTGDPSLGRR